MPRDFRREAIELPLLITHGTDDLLVAYQGSEALYARAGSQDKTLKLANVKLSYLRGYPGT